MHNIVLIGAGQLGSRHLQSLAKIDIPVSIDVVDPGLEQLKTSKERFEQIPEHINIYSVHYHTSLRDIRSDIDLCVIATTADVRSKITKELLSMKKVKNIIFEKVLFQSLNDFDDIEELLTKKKVNAWVNCPRRMYPFYREMKKLFKPGERISYHVNGGEWGLACNSIHFIDQMVFLIGITDYEIDVSDLDNEIFESKRAGFYELSGTLKITYHNKSELVLHSKKDSKAPDVISILGETCHVVVFESAGRVLISDFDDHWQWRKIDFKIPYQSELTHLAVTEILSEGHCDLTEFKDSSKLHKPMIKAFLHHFEAISGQKLDMCPIT